MVSGTLALKNGYYYAVLSYRDAAGKHHQKWVSTGLPPKGNKRRAEQELIRIRSEFEIPRVAGELSSNMLFADYLDQWLEIVRARIKPATFGSYQGMVKSTIGPYFRKIELTLTNAKIDGKCEIVCADRAKTKSSLRSLPLVSNIREKLLALREQQKENRRVCGNCYSKKYDGYVFVDAMGNIFNPRSVTANFSKLLEQNGLRHIRFHDLRHSCASLLLANDVPLKQIQEWLGHSDIGTTANIYSHLDYKSKITSANVMDNILTLPDTGQTGWHT